MAQPAYLIFESHHSHFAVPSPIARLRAKQGILMLRFVSFSPDETNNIVFRKVAREALVNYD